MSAGHLSLPVGAQMQKRPIAPSASRKQSTIARLSRCSNTAFLLCLWLTVACSRAPKVDELRHATFARVPKITVEAKPVLRVEPLTPELRAKGFDECNPHDPLGLGPYSPFGFLPLGRILIPQKGGHTDDMGYDVLVHFNGADAVRKLLVQSARGVVLVLVDKGVGGGRAYSRALGSELVFPALREAIEKALKEHSGSDKAHIRHLAVSSWSAGAVAVDKILLQHQPNIDAVIILDGLHGAWKQGAKHLQTPDSLDARFIPRDIELADRARRGETIFVLTHSSVDPYTFPSTTATAQLLLRELGLQEEKLDPKGDPFGQISHLDVKGLHVWGFHGNEEKAHCAQLFQMPRIVGEILEPAWKTPAMDRSVPPTPHPDWAHRKKK